MKAIQRWQWVLILSLGLNMFLGSAMAVYLTRLPDYGPPPPPPGGGLIIEFAGRLAPDDAEILMQAWKHWEGQVASPVEMFQAMRRMDAALAADPFDPASFDTALAEFQSMRQAEEHALAETLRQALPQMSKQGRAALAHPPMGPPPKP